MDTEEVDRDFLDSVAMDEQQEDGTNLSGAIETLHLAKDPLALSNSQQSTCQQLADTEPFYDCVLSELLLHAVLEVHRLEKIGLGFLFNQSSDCVSPEPKTKSPRRDGTRRHSDEYKIHISNYSDIFGQPLSNMSKMSRQQDCVCPECGRTMSALRFAPHLEKCMGFGGRMITRRGASRPNLAQLDRPASTGSAGLVSTHHTRTHAPLSSLVTNEQSESDDDSGSGSKVSSMAGDDDEDWLTASKRSKAAQLSNSKRRHPAKSSRKGRKAAPTMRREEEDAATPDWLQMTPSEYLLVDSDSLQEAPELNLGATETIELRNRKVKKAARRRNQAMLEEEEMGVKFDAPAATDFSDMRLLPDLGDLELLNADSSSF